MATASSGSDAVDEGVIGLGAVVVEVIGVEQQDGIGFFHKLIPFRKWGRPEPAPVEITPPSGRFLLRLRLLARSGGERHAVGQPVFQLFGLLRRAAVLFGIGESPVELVGQFAFLVLAPGLCPLLAEDVAAEGQQLVAGDAAEVVGRGRTPVTGHGRRRSATGPARRRSLPSPVGPACGLSVSGDAVGQQVQLLACPTGWGTPGTARLRSLASAMPAATPPRSLSGVAGGASAPSTAGLRAAGTARPGRHAASCVEHAERATLKTSRSKATAGCRAISAWATCSR